MSQRRSDPMKWVWCVLVLSSGTAWSPVSSVTVRSPVKIPTTIETQAKFFHLQFGDIENLLPDNNKTIPLFIKVQLSPYKIEFGHVCEDPNTWEQRYEKKDFKNHRDMGKIRWGDKKGGYGEHYWDLNHAGHAKNQDEDEYDDGDYNEELQDYPETGEKANNEREEYYPDASEYERSARPKRENSKDEVEALKGEKTYEEKQRSKQKILHYTEPNRTNRNLDNQDDFQIDLMKRSLKDNQQRHLRKYNKITLQPRDKNHIVLGVDHKLKAIEGTEKAEQINFVPYEVSAGLRRLNRQVTPESIPRLFLETSIGHVIDRAMEKAFVLQPVHNRIYN